MANSINATQIDFPNYHLKGVSKAGIGTCICVPEFKVSFDVAQGLPFAVPMRHHFISHCHQDHASGIPYLISQKAMMNIPASTFYLPKGTASYIDEILNIWQKLEGHTYDYQLIEVENEKTYNFDKNWYVKNFTTRHRVASQGYTLLQKRKHLKNEFQGLKKDEIRQRKQSGEILEEEVYHPSISFTGDSQIEFLDLAPEVKKSETLIMEVTYIDNKKTVESARKWGHIHFDEVIKRIPEIESKNIVFIHLSSRYKTKDFRRLVNEKLPNDKDRIHILT